MEKKPNISVIKIWN